MFAKDGWMPTWLKRSRAPAPLRSQMSRKAVTTIMHSALRDAGWDLNTRNEFSSLGCALARRGSTFLTVFCSGTDRHLRSTDVKDLHGSLAGRGMHPVFVYGETLDPRIRGHVRPGTDILLSAADIGNLDDAIRRLSPKMIGAVDCIPSKSNLTGWAKLSPEGRARLVAMRGGTIIGECEANIYRADLLHLGDAHYAFDLRLGEELDPVEMLNTVRVQTFYQDVYLGLLHYWKDIVIKV